MSKNIQQKMFDCIIQWQQSGLSKKSWCEQNNFPYSSFHYWHKRFRNQRSDSSEVTQDGFVQLMVQGGVADKPWCELLLVDGKRLFLHQPVPVAFIRSLLD